MTLRALSNIGATTTGEELPLCWLIEIAMPDGTFKRSNSLGTVDLTFGADTFTGTPGFDMSAATFTDGDGAPSVDLSRPIGTVGPVTFAEAASGILSGATVKLWIADYDAGTRDRIGSIYYVANVRTDDNGRATFDLNSVSKKARQLFLKRYGPGCKHQLGDSGCGVNLVSYTDALTVASVVDAYTVTVTGPSPMPADDYYNNGAAKFTSGDNNGLAYDVRNWVSSTGTLSFVTPVRRTVSVGDTLTAHAGCDKSTGAAGCSRFSNFARRLAWDHLPDDVLDLPQITENPPATQTTTSTRTYGTY